MPEDNVPRAKRKTNGAWRKLKSGISSLNHAVDRHLQGPWRIPLTIATVAVGLLVIAVGLLMMVVPGPGALTAFAGIAIIAKVFPPAKRFVHWVLVQFEKLKDPFLRLIRRKKD